MASGSMEKVGRIAEVSWGVTPDTPVFALMNLSDFSGGTSRNGIQSANRRGDRQVTDFVLGAHSVAFEVAADLSYGSYDTEIEALLGGTWAGDVVKAGVTRRSFTYERYFSDLAAGVNPWHRFLGAEVNSMSLSLKANDKVTCSFGFIAKQQTIAGAIITGATYTDPVATSVFNAFSASISVGGSPIATVTEMNLSINNGMAEKLVVGSEYTLRPSIDNIVIDASLTTWFEDSALLEDFLAATNSSLEFTLTDADGNDLIFELPEVVLAGGTPDSKGGGSITLPVSMKAKYNSTDETNITITRSAA